MFSTIFGNICTKPNPLRSKILMASALCYVAFSIVLSTFSKHLSLIRALNNTQFGAFGGSIFGIVGAIGAVYFFIVILYHCVRCVPLVKTLKLLWVISFFITGPVGSIAYYLLVFLPGWRNDRRVSDPSLLR